MRAGALALLLPVAASLVAPSAAHAADGASDPWFGADKRLHFEAAGSLAVVGYAGAAMLTDDRWARVAAGAGLALGAGAAKELWDLDGHGDPSWRDLTWDLAGAVAGVVVARAVDWLVHRYLTVAATGATARPSSGAAER